MAKKHMSATKLKGMLINFLACAAAISGGFMCTYFQYISDMEIKQSAKIAVPIILSTIIIFLIVMRKLGESINRKLTAIETAKEVGAVGTSNVIWVRLLKSMEFIVPAALLGVMFIIAGQCLTKVGWLLLEYLGFYGITIVANIFTDNMTKAELIASEQRKQDEFVDAVAKKVVDYK